MHRGGSLCRLLSFAPSPSPFPSAHSALSVQNHALCYRLLGRRCAVSSVAFSVSTTRKASTATRRPAVPQRSHGPSQTLLASDELLDSTSKLSAVSCPCVLWAAMQELPRLAPGAAAVLARRTRESVLRQDQCATDLLYFMGTEWRARQRRFSANGAPSPISSPQSPKRDSRHDGLGSVAGPPPRCDHLDGRRIAPSMSWSDLDMRLATPSTSRLLREFQTFSREGDSTNSWHASVGEHIDGEVNHYRSATPSLFRQQQELFDLRRRIAYLLASEGTSAGDLAEQGVPPLRSAGCRAALALSLTRRIFKACAASACFAGAASSAEEIVTAVTHDDVRCRSRFARGYCVQRGGADSASSATDELSLSLLRLLQPDEQIRCPYMYRSVAQPVELTPAEAYSLLTWCADQVRAYASVVAAAANRKDHSNVRSAVFDSGVTAALTPRRADATDQGAPVCNVSSAAVFSSNGKQDGGGGKEKGKGCQRATLRKTASRGLPRCSASATHPPSTLSMARHLPRDRISRAADGNDSTSPSSLGYLESELAAEVVSSATALMELAAAFACMAAESALPMADIFASHSHEEVVQQAPLPTTAKHHGADDFCDGDGAVSGGEALVGRVMGDVVLAVCDTLHTVRVSGLLGAYVESHIGGVNTHSGHDTSSGHVGQALDHKATQDQQMRQLRSLHHRLSFSQPVLQSVLCCERESWSQAVRLTERMTAWNAILGESLGMVTLVVTSSSMPSQLEAPFPSPSVAMGSDCATSWGAAFPAQAASLRSLSTDTLHMLLYVLAQHGRLAEVLRLCEVVCGVRAFHLFRDSSSTDEHDGADNILVLMAHLAAANAEPDAAAAALQQASSSPAVDESPSAAIDPASSASIGNCDSKTPLSVVVPDRMRSIERVVRAGVVPQRVLSVTEYAVLLRRVIVDHIRADSAFHAAAAVTTMHSASAGNDVVWWLSPSQVWRFSAGLAHHVRSVLCLISFQVNAHHGRTDMLSLEDLYVVLTLSRQLVRRHDVELLQLRDRQVKPVDNNDGGEGDTGGDLSAYRRRQLAGWGVVLDSPPSTPLKLPSSLCELPSLLPPLLTIPGSSAETCTASGGWSSVEAHAPGKAPWQCDQAILLHLLPARRRAGSPASTQYIQQLCATCHSALRRVRPLSSSVYTENGFAAQQVTATAQLSPRVERVNHSMVSSTVAVSAVLLSLVSQGTLSMLRAARYTRNIALFWDSALSVLAMQQLHGQDIGARSADALHGGGGLSERSAPTSSATRRVGGLVLQEEADCVREEVAYALALQAEASVGDSLVATRRLIAPLLALAPYLSAYTVASLVQRPFRRIFTWQQCLALLPYTPLGSRSQLWLVQRIAQDSEGRRHVFPGAVTVPAGGLPPAPAPHTSLTLFTLLSITAVQTARRMVTVRAAPRRHQQHRQPSPGKVGTSTTPGDTKTALLRSSAAPSSEEEASASMCAEAAAQADYVLLALLLECHWGRALQAFAKAPSRVQVGGAPHVVRLLVEADVWRDLSDAQRRPLVRLAVQSSAYSRGGASGLLEEVLQTTLEHGLWHTGLYFHQSFAAEEPELVRQCRCAQRYAFHLCCGLLGRTSITKMAAQMAKAARCSQWAAAAACFLRYATQQRGGTTVADTSLTSALSPDGSPGHAELGETSALTATPARAAGEETAPPCLTCKMAVPPTTADELESLAALLDAAASSPPFTLIFSDESALIPPELAHLVQTARYAMLHTDALWTHALRWLPTTALPLPFSHEQVWRNLCANNMAKLRALLPPPKQHEVRVERGVLAQLATATQTKDGPVALVVSTTEATLSLVEAARRSHRPQHANDTAKKQQIAVANALQVLRRAGAWEQATLLYDKAVELHCMPYASSSTVLDATLQGGAPWQVTLMYFFRMSQRQRPDVNAAAVALQACMEGGQWETAFRVLQQSALTQAAPAPRLVSLAVSTALQCGVWSRALAAAHRYRRTHNSQLAHTVLLTYVRTQHWNDAAEYFYDCIRRGLRPLDASLELAIIASEAASDEYRKTALMVGAIASALEDLYRMSGTVLEHIIFVRRHARSGAAQCQAAPGSSCSASEWVLDDATDINDDSDFLLS
ncbi:hypothetical protein MNV84_04457 [Leishmania braziliensis]|nr:hypothetical protein MNV84_04457 [Leishmania braziliensis]